MSFSFMSFLFTFFVNVEMVGPNYKCRKTLLFLLQLRGKQSVKGSVQTSSPSHLPRVATGRRKDFRIEDNTTLNFISFVSLRLCYRGGRIAVIRSTVKELEWYG